MKIGKFKKIAAIGLALTMAIGLLYTSGTVNAVEENPTEDNGLELNKTAVYKSDGTYDITLEAYTTGIMESTESHVPTDIVLVLDQSGSMEEPFTQNVSYEMLPFTGTYSQAYRQQIFDKEGHQLDVSRTWEWGWPTGFKYTFTCSQCGEVHKETVWGFGWTTHVSNNAGLYYRSYHSTEIQKSEALKNSVASFINSVNEDANLYNVDHKIAIVGFASNRGYGNNTEILSVAGNNSEYGSGDNDSVGKAIYELSDTDYKNALVDSNDQILDHAIDAIATNGATRADLGMEMAKKILDANPSTDRNKVVVMFTDGEPTSGSSFETEVANDAIRYSKNIKDNGAKVYTIGIFTNANPNDNSSSNRYMNYTSSNYPEAQNMSNYGDKIDSKYYLAASDVDELNKVFESISQDISKPTIELGPETIIKDTMSNYFEVVSDDITVEKVPCIGKNGEDYTFGKASPIGSGITKQVINNGKGVTVTGYNFDDNFVSIDNEGNPHGNMLRITFTVKPIDGFIGGLSVPTNGADSGLYQNSSTNKPLESFEMPYVDVDLNYDYDVTDQGMYIGNDWKDIQKFLDLDSNSLPQYKIENKPYSLHDSYVNDYVDVVYTIKHGNDTVGTYTVKAGSKQGILDLKDSFDATSFTGTEVFTVTVNVTNKAGQNASTTDEYEQKVNVAKNAKHANLYVFVPTINTTDIEKFLGESTNLNDRISVEDNWNCTDTSLAGDKLNTIKNTLTDKPTLTYTYSPNNNVDIDGNYKPATKGEHEFEVNVYNGKVNITQYSKFKHSHSNNPSCTQNHFFVVVKDGSITINKSINNDHLIDESKGTPIFTYKIEKELDNGEYKLVGYKYISMEQSGDDWIQKTPINLSGLEKGTYKITELSNLRYEKVKVQVDGSDYDNPILRVTIDSDSPSHTINYTNKVKSTSYDSDSSVLINKFVLDEDSKVIIQQDRLDQ